MVTKLIYKIKSLFSKPRRFTHANAFADNTDYIEVIGKSSYIVSKDGAQVDTSKYPLCDCLHLVKRGVWKEITNDKV